MPAAPRGGQINAVPGKHHGLAAGAMPERVKVAVERLDLEPDRDGRYRVNELCCQADTWQAAVVELMDRADVVLMDLSKFTVRRAGCTFELQQLAARLDNRRLVLLTDDTTDHALLTANVNPGSPPRTVVLASRTVTDRDVTRVWNEVLAAAYEGGAAAV